MEPHLVAERLADAAFAAWQRIQRQEDLHDKLRLGAGGNMTSVADAALEAAVLGQAEALGVAVLSEEAGLVPQAGAGLLAVVDPLDGSRNAGRGIPVHCTSVAVGPAGGRLGDLEAALVINLATGDRYSARRGHGAFANGRRVTRRAFDRAEVMVGLIADYSDTEIAEARAHHEHHIRDLGSAALEMCLVGTGALDAFVVRRPWLRVVDIAAATLFVRESGGQVLDPGTDTDLDVALDITVRSGIVAAHSPDAMRAVRDSHAEAVGATPGFRLPPGPLRWALVGKAGIPHVQREAAWVREHLRARGETVLLETDLAKAEGEPGHSLAELDRKADLFLTVGGDGTILMALAHTEKPVLGINAGAIGFLAEVEPPQAAAAIDAVLRRDMRIEGRDRLRCTLDGTVVADATNEVTLQTSRIAKLIHFRIQVDGEHLDTLRGDGVIVSTATGSTGYAMSVGGPLVHPNVHGTVVAPIAPFRLAARPWVVPSSAAVELTVLDRDSARGEPQARVVVDGQHGVDVPVGSVVRIEPSQRKARFIRLGSGFYERVRAKLTR